MPLISLVKCSLFTYILANRKSLSLVVQGTWYTTTTAVISESETRTDCFRGGFNKVYLEHCKFSPLRQLYCLPDPNIFCVSLRRTLAKSRVRKSLSINLHLLLFAHEHCETNRWRKKSTASERHENIYYERLLPQMDDSVFETFHASGGRASDNQKKEQIMCRAWGNRWALSNCLIFGETVYIVRLPRLSWHP